MKARSAVPIYIQQPFTLLGLPPILVIWTLLSAIAVFIAFMVLGVALKPIFTAVGMLALVLVSATGFGLSYLVSRRDPHVMTVYTTTRRFWRRGSLPCRAMMAGAPAPRSRGGRS